MPLVVITHDGPAAGASLSVDRCPREVQLTRDVETGKFDILNEPGDRAEATEAAYWYRWDGNPPGFYCGRGRNGSGRIVTLVYAPDLGPDTPAEAEQLALELG